MPIRDVDERTGEVDRRRYLKTTAVAGAAGLAGLAGCSGGGGGAGGEEPATKTGAQAQGEKTITLGASMSLTGSLATEGQLYRDSYKMTVQDVNEQGGVEVGGTNYKFELILYDDQSDPAKARQLFQKLIKQDGVNYLLGPYSSGVTLAAKPVVLKNQLPMVEAGGASLKIFKDQDWILGLLAPAPKYGTTAMSLANTFSKPPVKDIAVATQNGAFSKNIRNAGVLPKAKELGWNVTVDEIFPAGTNDLTPILNKVKNRKAELFLVLGHYKHATLAAKQMAQYDVNVPMTHATVGATTQKFIKEVGKKGNYFTAPSQWDSGAKYDGFFYGSAPQYVDRFTKKYDYQPDYHNAAGSAAILTYLDAFKRASKLDPKHVRNKLADINQKTFYGPVKFQQQPFGVLARDMFLYQWQNRKKKLVFPEKVAAGKPVYPAPKWSER